MSKPAARRAPAKSRIPAREAVTAREALVIWNQPELTGINRLRGRAFLYPFATPKAALAGTAPVVRSLNGTWKFTLVDRPESTPADFMRPDLDDRTWHDVAVPGCWTMQGHGQPWYTNVKMPWPSEPPAVPEANPTGLYRTAFTVPKEWTGKRLVLRFGSIESVGSIWVNGVPVGVSKDSRLPSEFDITEACRPGSNILAVQVIQWSDCSALEDQDQWWQAGIARDVELLAYPEVHLEDVFTKAGYDHTKGSGRVEITARVHGTPEREWTVRVQLHDRRGKAILKKAAEGKVEWFEPADGRRWTRREDMAIFAVDLPKVEAWTHETPNLYTAVVTLHDPKGKVVDSTRVRVGFRTVEIKDRSLLLNGERVFIRGVNRHEHHERTGKVVDRATVLKDIELLKRFHFNAVRTSHYPPDPSFFDLCDEHGILCIDETNLETHHHFNELCNDPRYASAFLDRGLRMVLRDRNHPSIIIWSLGNESGYGPNHDAMAAWMRHADGSRIIHYEGAIAVAGWNAGHVGSDLVCPMYPPPRDLINHATTSKDWRPLIMCEYAHAMGNSCGGLADYWQAFENTPGLQGGFIWEFLDHGIRKRLGQDGALGVEAKPAKDVRAPAVGWPGDREYWGYGGDFGETTHDTNFVCDGLVWPDRTPHVPMWEAKALFQPLAVRLLDAASRSIQVRSKYHFVSTAHLKGAWALEADGVVVAKGTLPRLDLGPGEAKVIQVPCGNPRVTAGQELHLTLRWTDSRDIPLVGKEHEAVIAQVALPAAADAPVMQTRASAGTLKVARSKAAIEVRGDNVAVDLDPASGRLTRWTVSGVDLLEAGPTPCVWRAPTDNDGIRLWDMQRTPVDAKEPFAKGKPVRKWMVAKLDEARTDVLKVSARSSKDGAEIVLRTRTWGHDRKKAIVTDHRLVVDAAGGISCEHRFVVDKDLPDLPRIGVHLLLPAGFEAMEWFGLGPHETYNDRRTCGIVGRFATTVTDEYVPHIMPQEHGHHIDTRWISLRRKDGAGILVSAEGQLEFNASHTDIHDLTKARHTTDVHWDDRVHLHLDAAHRGLGTASCGPDTFEQYRVPAGRTYRLAYRLLPLAKGQDAGAAHRG